MAMRILVTGANGFVGRQLVRQFAEQGQQVIALTRVAQLIEGAATCEAIDLADREALFDAVTRHLPDIIVNAAARGVRYGDGDPAQLYQINVQAAGDLLTAAAMIDAQRFIQIGSCFEYGSHEQPIREDAELNPNSPYALSKASASRLVLDLGAALGMDVSVLRLFSLWGAGEVRERLVPQIIHACLHDENLALTAGTQVRDYLHVEDAARMLVQLTLHPDLPAGGIVNVGSGRGVTVRDFATRIARHLSGAERLHFGSLTQRPDEHSRLVADVGIVCELLGGIVEQDDLFEARLGAQVAEQSAELGTSMGRLLRADGTGL